MAATPPPDPAKDTAGDTPWYQQVWFVIVVVVLLLALLFLLLFFLLRRFGPKEAYIRQRMPLPPPRPKLPRELFAVGAAGASGINAGPGVGVVNPAFFTPQPTPAPRHRLAPSPSPPAERRGQQAGDVEEVEMMTRRETGDGASSELTERETDLLSAPGRETDEEQTKGDNLSDCSSTTRRIAFNATHM